uniref:SCP domain-containing protein n=1 Tax=Haemonchus placei TaxID=6290 RepID=A0A0N4WJV9_HAEPC
LNWSSHPWLIRSHFHDSLENNWAEHHAWGGHTNSTDCHLWNGFVGYGQRRS